MASFKHLLVVGLILVLPGCASIETYTDPSLKTGKTGILYYPPKPYLLVTRTGAKDKPNDVQVVYLPDLSQPRFAVMRSGFGSSKLALTFSNGVLVSTSQESDPKITEAITALAGIPGAFANAAKTNAEADQIREEAGDIPKAADLLQSVATDLQAISSDPLAGTVLSPSQMANVDRVVVSINAAVTVLKNPAGPPGPADVEAVIKRLEDAKATIAGIAPSAAPGEPATTLWNKIRDAEKALDAAIAELKPKPAEQPMFSLYEILSTPAGPRLRLVREAQESGQLFVPEPVGQPAADKTADAIAPAG